MRTKVFYLLAMLLLLGSCGQHDYVTPAGPCLLTELRSSTAQPFVEWQQLVYDAQQRPVVVRVPYMSSYTNPDSLTISYNSSGRYQEVMAHRQPSNNFSYKAVYSYVPSGPISQVDVYAVPHTQGQPVQHVATFLHRYNSQQQLSEIRLKTWVDGQFVETTVYAYYYQNNKLARREHYELNPNSPGRWVTHLEFDNARRPPYLGSLPKQNEPVEYLTEFLLPHENNITSLKNEFHANGEVMPISYYTSTYSYNSQGLPVTQTTTTHEWGGVKSTNTYTFTYTCE